MLDTFGTIEETATYLLNQEQHPDIIFLDIQLSDGNSMELFELLEIKSNVIFTTAYDEFAVEAFRHNATDYLLKPIRVNQLIEAIKKAKPLVTPIQEFRDNGNQKKYKSRFLIRFGTKFVSIKTSEIAYVYSKDKIQWFFTYDGRKVPSDYKLQELESLLDPNIFYRANRQFIVNIESIAQIKRYGPARISISLTPHIDVPLVISAVKTRAFKKWINR